MHIAVSRLVPELTVGTPGGEIGAGAGSKAQATIASQSGPFTFTLLDGEGEQVTLRTTPLEPELKWSSAANGTNPPITDAGPSAQLESVVAPGTDRVFTVRKDGLAPNSPLDFFFFHNKPASGSSPMSTVAAENDLATTFPAGSRNPIEAYRQDFENLAGQTEITITGDASFEGDTRPNRVHDTKLAWRRATAVQAAIEKAFPGKFTNIKVRPQLARPQEPTDGEQDTWVGDVGWLSHGGTSRHLHWKASVTFPSSTPAHNGSVTVHRDQTPTPKPAPPVKDPPVPEVSPPPSWFRSAKVMVRLVDSQLIALQLDLEIDINTMTESKLQHQLPADTNMAHGKTLKGGTPIGPNNPADGILAMRVLVQTDPSTGRWTTLLTVGADPADTDGLVAFGWVAGVEQMPAGKDLGAHVPRLLPELLADARVRAAGRRRAQRRRGPRGRDRRRDAGGGRARPPGGRRGAAVVQRRARDPVRRRVPAQPARRRLHRHAARRHRGRLVDQPARRPRQDQAREAAEGPLQGDRAAASPTATATTTGTDAEARWDFLPVFDATAATRSTSPAAATG